MATNVDERKINIILDGKQVNASLKEMTAAAAVMDNQLKKMSADDPRRKALLQEFKQMKDRISDAKDEMYGMGKAQQFMQQSMAMATGFLIGGGIQGALSSIIDYFKGASNTEKEFATSLSNLSAITGATGDDLAFYEEQAEKIGQTTSLSASQAVEAFKLIGSAKPELLSNKEALAAMTEEAIKLAEASGMDLPDAANSLASALNQFGESSEEANRYINVMAAGAKEGSAEITEVAASLKNAGTVAAGANVSFEATNAMIQSLSTIAIKGGEAGTGLKNVLLTLQSGADDTNPAIVGLETAMQNLGNKNLSTAEMAKLFGKENVVVAQHLVKNRDEISRLTEAMTGTNVAYEQAATNMDNLEGDMKALDSASESLRIVIGKGLNVAIREGVQLGTKMILWLMSTPKFVKENQDVFWALGSAIIALNLANIKAAASTLYHAGVEKGRAIATKASAAAQWVLNAAMTANPIGLLIASVAALVGAFVVLYNRSEAVRGGVAGLWNAFKELISIAGDIALFLINPLKNAGKIREIMNAGERLGKAFSDGYNQKIAEEKAAADQKANSEHEQDKAKAKDKGKDLGKATGDGFAESLKGMSLKQLEELLENETDATHKKLIRKRIEFLKELERKQKEHADKVKRDRETFDKAEEQYELELAKLKIEIMNDGIDKVLAKLRFQHEQELKEMVKQREAVKANIAATAAEKAAAIAVINEKEIIAVQQHEKDVAEAKNAQHKQNLEEWYAQLDEEEAYLFEVKKNQLFNTLDAEFQTEQARLQLHRDNLQQRLLNLEANGQSETLEAYKLKNAILQIDKEKSDGQIANAKRTADMKRQIEQMSIQAATSFLQLGIDLMSQDEKARKKNASAIKAFSAGKVMVDVYQEISGYMANPASTATMGVLGAIQSGFAMGRALMAFNNIMAQKFAAGGSTGAGNNNRALGMGHTIPLVEVGGIWQMASGVSGGSLGSFANGGHVGSARLGLIGEAGAEWVMPNWMLTSPKYAATAAWLEAERQGAGRKFALGGSTGAPMPADFELQASRSEELLEQLLDRFDNYQAEISTWQRELHTNYYSGNALEANNRRAKAEELASW